MFLREETFRFYFGEIRQVVLWEDGAAQDILIKG